MAGNELVWLGLLVVAVAVLLPFQIEGKQTTVYNYISGSSTPLVIAYPSVAPTVVPTPTPLWATPSPTVIRPDLSALFLPYIAASNPVPLCTLHVGNWIQTAVRVGCFNMGIPINITAVCSSPAYIMALHQCQVAGAVGVCSLNDFGCYYA